MTEVSAAVIKDISGRILICRRPEGKNCALLWEFPGGKREKGETAEQCLVRECREELGVTVVVKDEIAEISYDYPYGRIHLIFFSCYIKEGSAVSKEHAALAWVRATDMGKYSFCPADSLVLKNITGE